MTATADIRAEKSAFEQGFLLGELRVDPQDGEVTGPGGREQLDPKVMNVLLLLAEHAGHIVSREDLLLRLWPNAVVTDDVLSRCIYELRRHVSQAGGDEQLKALIETVPKRGYRLNGEITPLPSQPVSRSPRPAARIALIGAASRPSSPPVVALAETRWIRPDPEIRRAG
jgi:DNA-binding winged helix-turn-helix (wHTH) protein